jgi:hypothetical protein
MRALVAVSQLVPNTIWETHLVSLGRPSWKTRNSVFGAIPDRMGVRDDVFDGSRPNIEKILSISSQHLVYSKLPQQVSGAADQSECRGERERGSAEHVSTSVVGRSW